MCFGILKQTWIEKQGLLALGWWLFVVAACGACVGYLGIHLPAPCPQDPCSGVLALELDNEAGLRGRTCASWPKTQTQSEVEWRHID